MITVILGLACVGLLAGWFICWVEKEYWVKKYMDAQSELEPPFVFDYTKQEGWKDDARL